MVRVVPIIHRAPPPALDKPFGEPAAPVDESNSDTSSGLPLRFTTGSNQRRTYLSSKSTPNGTSWILPSPSPSSSNGATATTPCQFSLFDSRQELAITEPEFIKKLNEEGLELKIIAGDGNCMFRAVADQVYGDEEMHEQIRACCLDYMEQEADFFRQFVAVDFSEYVKNKRQLRVYGDHLELQAMAELYNRPVEIRIPGRKTLRICEVQNDEKVAPMRLSYHNNNHYNSVKDPNDTTIGVGLGLPANQRPTTDKTLLAEAVEQSLNSDADKQLLDTAKAESEQEQLAEDLLTAAAKHESELEHLESELYEHGQIDDDELYAQQLAEELARQEEDELEAAIRMSLAEGNGS